MLEATFELWSQSHPISKIPGSYFVLRMFGADVHTRWFCLLFLKHHPGGCAIICIDMLRLCVHLCLQIRPPLHTHATQMFVRSDIVLQDYTRVGQFSDLSISAVFMISLLKSTHYYLNVVFWQTVTRSNCQVFYIVAVTRSTTISYSLKLWWVGQHFLKSTCSAETWKRYTLNNQLVLISKPEFGRLWLIGRGCTLGLPCSKHLLRRYLWVINNFVTKNASIYRAGYWAQGNCAHVEYQKLYFHLIYLSI